MTPQRMREAAQILGELGNGKMANELMGLAEHSEKGTTHKGALAAVSALKQADAVRNTFLNALQQVKDYEAELEKTSTDRVNQRKEVAALRGALETLSGCLPPKIFVYGAYGEMWTDSEAQAGDEYEAIDFKEILGEE